MGCSPSKRGRLHRGAGDARIPDLRVQHESLCQFSSADDREAQTAQLTQPEHVRRHVDVAHVLLGPLLALLRDALRLRVVRPRPVGRADKVGCEVDEIGVVGLEGDVAMSVKQGQHRSKESVGEMEQNALVPLHIGTRVGIEQARRRL